MNKGHLQAQKWRQKEVRGLPQPRGRLGAEKRCLLTQLCLLLRSYHMCLLLLRELHHVCTTEQAGAVGTLESSTPCQRAAPFKWSLKDGAAQDPRRGKWAAVGSGNSREVQMLLLVSAVVLAGPPKPLEGNKAAEATFLVAFHLPGWFVPEPRRELRVHPSKPVAVLAQLCPLQCTPSLLLESCPWMPANSPGPLALQGSFPWDAAKQVLEEDKICSSKIQGCNLLSVLLLSGS